MAHPEVKLDAAVFEQMRKLNEEYSEVEQRLIGRDKDKNQILRNALALLTKNEQSTVEIVEANILDAGCTEIANALAQNTRCTVLRLREVGMGGPGTVAIVDAVLKCAQLEELYLDDNDLSSQEATGAVAKLIAANTGLKVLGLESNKIEADGMRAICAALGSNTNLEILELSENFFGDRGVSDLIAVLKKNKTLQVLKLSNDEISNVGALQLAKFMASAECSCQEVTFSTNHLLNSEGVRQVQELLRCSQYEEVGVLSFKRVSGRRAPQQPVAPATVVPSPATTTLVSPPSSHSNISLICFGLAAVGLGLGVGLFLATRIKRESLAGKRD